MDRVNNEENSRERLFKNKKELRREYILTAPLLPLLIKMAVPTIIGMLVAMIYNLTDTFFQLPDFLTSHYRCHSQTKSPEPESGSHS